LFTGTLTNPNFAAVNPDLHKDLLMRPGVVVRFRIHDTSAGLRIDMADLTTGQSGSMTASVANGFGHILYQPKSATCHEKPYAFHPADLAVGSRPLAILKTRRFRGSPLSGPARAAGRNGPSSFTRTPAFPGWPGTPPGRGAF
jgi:hypothetical protein